MSDDLIDTPMGPISRGIFPAPVRIGPGPEVTDEELKQFLGINDFKNRDEELVRDILCISRIYERNFDRLMKEENPIRKQQYQAVERYLDRASAFMRELAVIACFVDKPKRSRRRKMV